MATPDRQELVRNAVVFLADPKTQASPLTQRVQFLEAKGLTGAEIEEAMRVAAANQSAPRTSMQTYPPGAYGPMYGPMPYSPVQPPPPQWDWRDYFITAVVSGTVAYGAVSLFRKFVLPHLQPPSATAYEQDKDAMAAQFDAAEALLKEIQAETAAVRVAVEEQNEKVTKVTQDVEAAVKDMRDGETRTRDEMREIREEVNNVREMLPKLIDKNKESHNQSLAELQQELKSLKALLLSRGPSMSTGPSTPILPGKPAIPAWQLASTPLPSMVLYSYLIDSHVIQWRHAVESIAQVPKTSQDASTEEDAPRSSVDSSIRTSLSSSSQLAESALSNLRKTLAVQRAASPSPSSSPSTSQAQIVSPTPAAEPAPTPSAPKPRPAGRTTLEDRLRARFAVGDASGNSTPATSARATPSPVLVADHPLAAVQDQDIPVAKGPPNPLSPTSAPLPDSPLVSPVQTEPPASLHAASESISAPQQTESPPTIYSGDEAASDLDLSEEKTVGDLQEATMNVDGFAEKPEAGQERESEASNDLEGPEKNTPDEPSIVDKVEASEEPSLPHPPEPSKTNDTSAVEEIPSDPSPAAEEVVEDVAASATMEPPAVLPDSPQHNISSDATFTLANGPESNTSDVDNGPRVELDVPRPITPMSKLVDVESLQKRLKLVEQRFADVSTSFKRLQAEKLAADRVLRELTSVESVTEAEALRDFLQNMNFKAEMAQDEIRRLNGKLTRQDERIDELRDIHRLESKSQSDQIDKLKAQVEETEKLLQAAHGSTSHVEQESAKRKAEIDRLQGELDKATSNAKEEEEKRTKAIALLKTVRQKLVKAEKERDDALKEISTLKDADKVEREKEKAERVKLHGEIDKVNSERETAMQGLRAHYDKEVISLRERHEKELAALRGQYELEAITTKTTHVKEIENKKARISDLESTVRALSREKDELFDQLQMRQAELESSQSSLESLQGQNTELQYQLREATDRIALLQEEFTDARREHDIKVQSPRPSTEDVTRLLAAAESKYETRFGDLRRRLAEAERERDEGEAHWSQKLAERAREVESLQAVINNSQKSQEVETESAQVLKNEIEALKGEIRAYQQQIADLHAQLEKSVELEVAAKNQLAELSAKTADMQQLMEDMKSREAQIRTQNKTLRDELRKVQSSVALLEKQRGPGVGYWASRNESTSEIKSPTSSVSDLASREASSRPSTPSTVRSTDEEVNFEYLRNVILQFLEHKEMRLISRQPHLIRILSTILRFTPQETRRLIAKA
ncbi:hypothetical protein C8Q80DRAFT_1340485 [Daedaleopsis nitida]|nr:hypothetical protein C8Q80DRAFT_1340485 [Daedaleopsis nitida]